MLARRRGTGIRGDVAELDIGRVRRHTFRVERGLEHKFEVWRSAIAVLLNDEYRHCIALPDADGVYWAAAIGFDGTEPNLDPFNDYGLTDPDADRVCRLGLRIHHRFGRQPIARGTGGESKRCNDNG